MIKKEILFRTILASIILSILILSFYVYLVNIKTGPEKHKFDTSVIIPKIKEHYDKTNLKEYKKYENDLNYDKVTNEITMNSNEEGIDYEIIGKFGKIYTNSIQVKEEENPFKDNPNYVSFDTEDGPIYIRKPSNYTNDDLNYDSASPLNYYDKNMNINFDYIILEENGSLSLLDIKTFDILELDESIKYIYIIPGDYYTLIKNPNNTNYFIIKNKDDKFGLIDKTGNTVIEAEYDFIFNSTTKDEYVVMKNGKYGLINSKNEILYNIEYDYISYIDNYILFTLDDKISIYYNNKQIVDYVIPYHNNPNDDEVIKSYLQDNYLYLISTYPAQENSTTFWTYGKAFLITNKGIIRKIDSYIIPIYNNEDDNKIEYFYSIRENNGDINVTFYDTDFYEYYSYSFKYEKAYDYQIDIEKIDDTSYYKIRINYSKPSLSKTYYVDLFNSKETEEAIALKKYFDNGYSWTLNDDKVLKIYKNYDIIGEYTNIEEYFGGYYFYKDKTLYTLTFEKG